MIAMPIWPPEHRCENCGWWERLPKGLIERLFGWKQGLGRCKHPDLDSHTWRSYVCVRHTAAASADIGPSLRAQQRMKRLLGVEEDL